MKLATCLPRIRGALHLGATAPGVRRRQPARRVPAPTDDPQQPGCGWFDSSHELQAGLQVIEHASPARVVDDLPLGWWLAWQLDDRRGSVGSARGAG